MDTRFELQCKAVAEFKWSFFCIQATSDCVNCVMAAGLTVPKATCSGELQVINIPQLSISIVTMEGEIVDVNVWLKPVVSWDSDFPEHHQTQLWIYRGLGSYFKTGLSFADLTWLVVSNSEGKERLP